MVRNDAPTSLRRGFGYYQARRSGMGGIRRDRSPNQINEAIDENNAARRVRGALSNDPDWARFVKHWILDGMTAEVTEDALFRAQGHMSDRMKGFPANYCMRIWGWD
jgi:hypothetical protein